MGCITSIKPKILILIGSARKKSVNTGLVREIEKFPTNSKLNIDLLVITLDKIPIYSTDQQNRETLCEEITKLRNHTYQAKAVLFVTPEINGSISPLILNAFLWLSKSYHPKRPPPLLNKKAGVISASYLSQNQINDCLQIGDYLSINFFKQSFHLPLGNKPANEEGKIVSSAQIGRLFKWYQQFVEFILKK